VVEETNGSKKGLIMNYEYLIMEYPDAEEDLRGIFGVDDTILPDAVIHRLPNMPAAEIEVSDRISVDITTLSGMAESKAKLGILYVAAANCLTAVKVNVLRVETDNKTTGQRFEDALKVTEEDLRAKANKAISDVETALTGAVEHPNVLDFVSPGTDEITGATQ
jgi:hypothetical protein